MRIFDRISAYFERRATLKDTYGWFFQHLMGGGSPSASGETVGPSTALTLDAYFAAVRAISEDIAKIPLILYRRLSENEKTRATEHPLYRILHDAPNSDMSSMDFRSTVTAHALNRGNGYAEIVRNSMGQVLGLVPLDPARMRIDRADDGSLIYIFSPESGGEVRMPQRAVFHLRGLGSNGIEGYSIARLARESVGTGLAEQKSGGAFFGNGSQPRGVLESPKPLKRESMDEFRRQWEAQYGGAANAHKTAVLSGGMTFKPLSMSNEDAQFIEARHLTVESMARWMRVPPHIIGHLLRSTFDNITQQSIEYVTYCLLSWATRWEQEIQRKLISPRERNVYAEHLFAGLLRGDTKSRFEAYAVGRQWGWLSANDILRMENENTIGPAGDIYLVPANMQNAERLLEEPDNGMDDSDGGGNGGAGTEPDGSGETPEETRNGSMA